MNILTDSLPNQVEVNGSYFDINTDFRIGILFELLMESKKTEQEKIVEALQLYYSILPDDLEESIQQMIWFYQCGDSKEKKSKTSGKSEKKIYSFEYDQNLIYTAFFQYYQIDLNEIKNLHWWKFHQLFIDLPKDSSIKQAMMYRNMTLTTNMSSEQRNFYAEMKTFYKLPDGRTEEQKAKTFALILANGMHVKEREDDLYE